MNVLSLFDGMSCGKIALERSGIKVENYFASEIDKYAMQVAKKNWPDIKHIGDVIKIKGGDLPNIDLLIGGSPCQGFSAAGKRLNFDDPRSALFFEFVRLLKETKPKYFLLENVRMKQEWQDVISDYLGVKPITINSALVSAQNRVRLYWTNIPNIEQPDNKGILLKDILEDGESLRSKSQTIPATIYKENAKSMVKRKKTGLLVKRPCEPREFNQDSTCHHAATATDIKGNESIKRVYAETGKSPALTTMGGGHREPKVLVHESTEKNPNVYNGVKYRKLTPLECERLQTVPDGYTEGVSNTQRYKMIGNGWTVDVVAHIFKGLLNENL